MARTIDAVLFDCDGTLADSEPMISSSLVDALRDLGFTTTVEAVRRVIGPPLSEMAEALTGPLTPAQHTLLHERYFHHAIPRRPGVRPLPGAEPLLDALREHGLPLAMVTNKIERSTAAQIAQFGWDGRFGAVVCADSVPNPKPAPDPAIEALRRLSVAPHRAAFVGDTESDTLCARAAGIAMIIGLTGTRSAGALRAAGATHVVDSLDRVLPLLLGVEVVA